MYLIYFIDIIILNACCITIAYAFLLEMDWLWGLLAFNNIAVIALRQWIYRIMETNWLASPLNRTLKRLADIVCSLAFLLTLLPLILFIHTIYHLCSKKYRPDATIAFRDIQVTNGPSFTAAFITPQIIKGNTIINYTPIAFNILFGTISMWDIYSIKLPDINNSAEEQVAQYEETYTPEQTTTDEFLSQDKCPVADNENLAKQEPTLFDNQQEYDEYTK